MMDPDTARRVVVEVSQSLGFLTPTGPGGTLTAQQQDFLIRVRFHGDRQGSMWLALSSGIADAMVRNLSGDDQVPTIDDCTEAACELANVVAGNLVSALFGDQAECHLDTPIEVPVRELPEGAVGVELLEGMIAVAVEH